MKQIVGIIALFCLLFAWWAPACFSAEEKDGVAYYGNDDLRTPKRSEPSESLTRPGPKIITVDPEIGWRRLESRDLAQKVDELVKQCQAACDPKQAYDDLKKMSDDEVHRMWKTSSKVHHSLEHSSIPGKAKDLCFRAIVPCERIYEVELEIRRTKRLMKK
jgi:hypothetical protein